MGKPLLILDLDETLIFSTIQGLTKPGDFKCFEYLVYKRPFVASFLSGCAEHFDLAVWTSSTIDYARCIVAELFAGLNLEFLWARERCTRRYDFELQEPYWVKDLRKVKSAGFPLERVLMVDDTPRKLERNYGNIVRVSEFRGESSDRELIALLDYLIELSREDDFRRIEKRGWNQG
jgi:RNA polymerase II subunit A small phosphatase-like protein